MPASPAPVHPRQLLGGSDVRRIAGEIGLTPTKRLGQNFVTDPGTVRRIVSIARVHAGSTVIEVGPGLGSLTLGLLETGARVIAIEIDRRLAARLTATVTGFQPGSVGRLTVVHDDALAMTPGTLPGLDPYEPCTLVANLPYNVATPIVLTMFERFGTLTDMLVMVQREVADRLVAAPGSKAYGAPSAKLAWYGRARRVGVIGRHVFWPVPNVDSALVSVRRSKRRRSEILRPNVFRLIDAAFAQRRKTLRSALRTLLDPSVYVTVGIDPTRRGETLTVEEFARLASAAVYAHSLMPGGGDERSTAL